MLIFLLLFKFQVVSPSVALAESVEPEIVLPVIRLTGNASEILNDDGVLPVRRARARAAQPRGDLNHGLSSMGGWPSTNYGQVGTLSQARGLGRGADEVNVESLGVPLNPPQGGGFDFTAFPSFVWEDYAFRLGPTAGAYDPRTISATLSLKPWTAAILDQGASGGFARTRYFTSGLRQVAAGGSDGKNFAILAGHSHGKVTGPTGSISARKSLGEKWRLGAHLLGTDVSANSPGPKSFASPRASTRFERMIPILQLSSMGADDDIFRATTFFDWGRIRFTDLNTPTNDSDDKARQFGIESVLKSNDWKVGGGAREMDLHRKGFSAPSEWFGHLGASKEFRTGDDSSVRQKWVPELRVLTVSRVGASPAGSLGWRRDVSFAPSLFAKISHSPRYSTLNERYYSNSFYQGNPNLKPERIWTASLGAEWKTGPWSLLLETFHQQRFNVIVSRTLPTFTTTPENAGRAWVQAVRTEILVNLSSYWSVSNSLMWAKSKLLVTQVAFPYQPDLTSVGAVSFFPQASRVLSEVQLSARAFSKQVSSSSGDKLGGYGVVDLSGRVQISAHLDVDARIDNLADRRYEAVRDFPAEGRVLSVGFTGRL